MNKQNLFITALWVVALGACAAAYKSGLFSTPLLQTSEVRKKTQNDLNRTTGAHNHSDDKQVYYVVFAGQSNAEGHFQVGPITGSDVFQRTLADHAGEEPHLINVAVGGSASNETIIPGSDQYWWNLASDRPGPLLVAATNRIRQDLPPGGKPDAVIWAQGETDAHSLYFGAPVAQVSDNLSHSTRRVISHLRQTFGPSLPILVQEIGYFPTPQDSTRPDAKGFDRIREAQANLIASDPCTFLGAETNGLSLRDTLHFDNDAYKLIAADLADVFLATQTPSVLQSCSQQN